MLQKTRQDFFVKHPLTSKFVVGKIYRNADMVLVWLGSVPAVLQYSCGSIAFSLQETARRILLQEEMQKDGSEKAAQVPVSNELGPAREVVTQQMDLPEAPETKLGTEHPEPAADFTISMKVICLAAWLLSRRWFGRLWVLRTYFP